MKFKDNLLEYGILAAIVLAVAYYIGTRTGKGNALNQAEAQLQSEISKQPLTYEQSNYSAMADNLETAMFPLGTDESAVYSVLTNLRNKSDVLQLIKTFGLRRQQFTIGGSNLNQWLTSELDASELAHVNDILSRNGIDYTF